ncbi:PQQ-binding-like beta-propeller repeat protein [Actinoplanes sp. DH11]|uniref:outer membrane protein assembly factor BamB family protein n=1 Tax=Actinoplanes sp. DH11 TaxID=2857011 RepID=UPI001E5F4F94|nr:PQQ-binding-like beta-propeller repeat protein [Actinoplanes sp. DH11]
MLLRTVLAVALLVVAGLIGWRVLAPAEVLASATTPYPSAPIIPAGVTGRTSVAPLVVDGRVRVYAAKHQVRADGPVNARTVYTARWSFRRWPEQLSGVTASGPTVVTRWSDGELVAIDARTGEIAWRTDGPDSPGYAGHRTGAATVWAPPGLRLAAGNVVAASDQELAGYDLSTGAVRWRIPVAAGCADGFTTVGGAYACAGSVHDASTGAPVSGWPAGPWTPVGCDSDRSGCAGFRDGAGQGWIDGKRVPALDDPSTTVAAGIVVGASGDRVTGTGTDGTRIWERSGPARVLGGSGGSTVLLLTPENTLVGVDAGTGTETLRFPLAMGTESTLWKAGGYRIAGGYLALERLRTDAPDDPESPIYYLTLDAVIIAAL